MQNTLYQYSNIPLLQYVTTIDRKHPQQHGTQGIARDALS